MQYQDTAHFNMLEQELRPNEISNPRVLAAFNDINRGDFVDESLLGLAYAGMTLPIGHGQMMLPPLLQGKILQTLDIQADEDVLEIGTGTGYLTALLAQLAHHVTSVELYAELTKAAKQNLANYDINNVTLVTGDASRGWPLDERLDVIVLTAAFVDIPDTFLHNLKIGGRLLCFVGEAPVVSMQLIHRTAERDWHTETVLETVVPPMVNAEPETEFEF